jgi:dephospho-CoA kinase
VKVVAIVGMAGAGKSVVSGIFERNDFTRVYFGDVTMQEIRQRGIAPSEANERRVREWLREEYGMAAYAKLNLNKINAALEVSDVVVDGLYSWEEYLLLRDLYGEEFVVVAIWASPPTRYKRLASRISRPLTPEESLSRDKVEIENINKGGPIAMADVTILNEDSPKELREQTEKIISVIRWKRQPDQI